MGTIYDFKKIPSNINPLPTITKYLKAKSDHKIQTMKPDRNSKEEGKSIEKSDDPIKSVDLEMIKILNCEIVGK